MNVLTCPPISTSAVPHQALQPEASLSHPQRFTADGGRPLEQHLEQSCAKIAAGIRGLVPPQKLKAVLLGGGYGRGEGGVLQTPSGERPYNDLEFYVFLRGNRHWNEQRFGRALHVLGEILTPQVGVEVEFKISSLRELEQTRVSMFSYDLVMGHRWVVGHPELLARCSHHREARDIPLSEATRLLMNRCSGLLFAKEKLERPDLSAGDADFVRRNIAKAELALGDVLLVAHHCYHWSVRERHRHLEAIARESALPWMDAVRRHHAVGVEFKLHPQRSTAARAELAAQHAAVAGLAQTVWLWLESHRLGVTFASVRNYAESSLPKCGETSAFRNLLVNLKCLGHRPTLEGRSGRHPRERILNVLPLLLWEPETLTTSELLRFVQRELQTGATTFAEVTRAYRNLWSRVN